MVLWNFINVFSVIFPDFDDFSLIFKAFITFAYRFERSCVSRKQITSNGVHLCSFCGLGMNPRNFRKKIHRALDGHHRSPASLALWVPRLPDTGACVGKVALLQPWFPRLADRGAATKRATNPVDPLPPWHCGCLASPTQGRV